MKRSIHMILLAVLLVALLTANSTGSAAGEKIIIKLAHADSIDAKVSRKQAMCEAFAAAINGKGDGLLEVQVFGAGQLGGEREYVEAIKAGLVQAGVASGVIANFYANSAITDIPYLFPSSAIAAEVLDGSFGKKMAAGFLEASTMRCIAFGEVGFRHFTNSKRPIKSPADIKGLKIRVQETPLYMTLIKAMGGSPTPVAWPETYSALQTGVVDGQENPFGSIISGRLYEVQKYMTIDGHVYGVDWFIMNDKFYKKLSVSLRKLVLNAAKIAVATERGFVKNSDATGMKFLLEKKMEIYTPTAAELLEFRKATQQPIIDYLKSNPKIDPLMVDAALKAVKSAEAKVK
jgi:tripartite ATP-independent transporter DctP family solute receptor